VQLARELRHPPLEPVALGLQGEGVRVAVGERPLEAGERGRLLGLRGLGEQLVDLLEQCGDRFGCQRRGLANDYRSSTPGATRAARPIHPND
jgi:hypothetical protein